MRILLSFLVILFSSSTFAKKHSLPEFVCGTMEQNALIKVNKSRGIAKVFMSSGGYTDSFKLYQTENSRIYCDDSDEEDTIMCFHHKKTDIGKSKLYFLKDGVKIEIAQVDCQKYKRNI
jgi:hypothetical protein